LWDFTAICSCTTWVRGLSDGAAYYNALPNSTEEEETQQPLARVAAPAKRKAPEEVDETKLIGALRQEWRTPPLWGVRDSAPYLHDGRADTLEQAIALHAGEAQASLNLYVNRTANQRLQHTTFLKSLEAPR
jgi:cytochrome c peroxidase